MNAQKADQHEESFKKASRPDHFSEEEKFDMSEHQEVELKEELAYKFNVNCGGSDEEKEENENDHVWNRFHKVAADLPVEEKVEEKMEERQESL